MKFGLVLPLVITVLAVCPVQADKKKDKPKAQVSKSNPPPAPVNSTPDLIEAIFNRDLPGVIKLLDAGANVHFAGNGQRPLWTAFNAGDVNIMRELIKRGARADGKDYEGKTILTNIWPVSNVVEAIQIAIEAGADVNAQTIRGGTALRMYATYRDSDKIIKLLLDSGADITKGGNEALLQACYNGGNLETIRLLLQAGAKVNFIGNVYEGYRYEWQATPLMAAAARGNTPLVHLLLEAGANPEIVTERNQSAADRAAEVNPETLKLLVQAGSPVSREGLINGLSKAAKLGNIEVAKILIAKGADVNATTGWPPALHVAAGAGQVEFVKFLIENKADVNASAPWNGFTPLQFAAGVNSGEKFEAAANSVAITQILLAAGANPNKVDKCGDNAIMSAVYYDLGETIRVLRQAGADTQIRGCRWNLPITVASKQKKKRALEALSN